MVYTIYFKFIFIFLLLYVTPTSRNDILEHSSYIWKNYFNKKDKENFKWKQQSTHEETIEIKNNRFKMTINLKQKTEF